MIGLDMAPAREEEREARESAQAESPPPGVDAEAWARAQAFRAA